MARYFIKSSAQGNLQEKGKAYLKLPLRTVSNHIKSNQFQSSLKFYWFFSAFVYHRVEITNISEMSQFLLHFKIDFFFFLISFLKEKFCIHFGHSEYSNKKHCTKKYSENVWYLTQVWAESQRTCSSYVKVKMIIIFGACV